MSDPSTWPTTPPTEPGWYWMALDGEVEIVKVGEVAPEFWFCRMHTIDADSWSLTQVKDARWRPGRIEP